MNTPAQINPDYVNRYRPSQAEIDRRYSNVRKAMAAYPGAPTRSLSPSTSTSEPNLDSGAPSMRWTRVQLPEIRSYT